jgi:hypothetical protein
VEEVDLSLSPGSPSRTPEENQSVSWETQGVRGSTTVTGRISVVTSKQTSLLIIITSLLIITYFHRRCW